MELLATDEIHLDFVSDPSQKSFISKFSWIEVGGKDDK